MRVVAAGIPRPPWLVRSESLSRGGPWWCRVPPPSTASYNYQSLTAGRMARWHTSSNYTPTSQLTARLLATRGQYYQDSISQEGYFTISGRRQLKESILYSILYRRLVRLFIYEPEIKSEVRLKLADWLRAESPKVWCFVYDFIASQASLLQVSLRSQIQKIFCWRVQVETLLSPHSMLIWG